MVDYIKGLSPVITNSETRPGRLHHKKASLTQTHNQQMLSENDAAQLSEAKRQNLMQTVTLTPV